MKRSGVVGYHIPVPLYRYYIHGKNISRNEDRPYYKEIVSPKMMFDIGSTTIGGENTVVIAEAGKPPRRLDYAEELIKSAARAGADIIKFQTYKASKLTTQNAPRFWSWEGERDKFGSQFDSYSLLDSFGREQYQQLIQMCNENGIEFMSTPFDVDSADMLVEIGMKGFKVASCDLTNLPFLKHLAAKQLPILLSTGASTVEEIKTAVDVIKQEGIAKFALCNVRSVIQRKIKTQI